MFVFQLKILFFNIKRILNVDFTRLACYNVIVRREVKEMELINQYIDWCKQKGYKPSSGQALKEFIAQHKEA